MMNCEACKSWAATMSRSPRSGWDAPTAPLRLLACSALWQLSFWKLRKNLPVAFHSHFPPNIGESRILSILAVLKLTVRSFLEDRSAVRIIYPHSRGHSRRSSRLQRLPRNFRRLCLRIHISTVLKRKHKALLDIHPRLADFDWGDVNTWTQVHSSFRLADCCNELMQSAWPFVYTSCACTHMDIRNTFACAQELMLVTTCKVRAIWECLKTLPPA